MKALLATSPGHPGRSNEDFVAASPDVVVLLDGAGIPGTESICRHGVAWYAHTLGGALLASLTQGGRETDPVSALAESIDQVAARHRHTCDIANPSSPQATVATVRVQDDRVDYLVLADAFVVLDPAEGAPVVATDPREVAVRDECTAPLRGLSAGTPEYARVRGGVVDALRARRNQPGGYWIAKDDPRAATEAVTGSVSLRDLNGMALLSNGASRIVDPYRLADWPTTLALLRTSGADALLQSIRRAEARAGGTASLPGFQEPDDATVAYGALTPGPSWLSRSVGSHTTDGG
jgi:hypothetical protein